MVYILLPRRWEQDSRSGYDAESGWPPPAPATGGWWERRYSAMETPAEAPPGLQTVRGPDVYRDKDGNFYNKDFKQINEKFEVVHARGSRGGKRTRPEHKVSYSVDHRPFVFDPVTGRRERPTDAQSSSDR